MSSGQLRVVVAICAVVLTASAATIAYSLASDPSDEGPIATTSTTAAKDHESDFALAECKAQAVEAGSALIEAASTKPIPPRPEGSDNYLKYTREGQVLFAEMEADRLVKACGD